MDPKFMQHWRSHSKKVDAQFEPVEKIEGRNPPRMRPKRTRTVKPVEDVEEEVIVEPPPRDTTENITVEPPVRRIIPPPPAELHNAYVIGDALVAAGLDRSTTRHNLYYRLQEAPLLAYWQAEGSLRSPYFSVESANTWLRYHIVQPFMVEDYNDEQEPMYFDSLEELITHMTGVVRS
jgi:hypothetical protein